ncbi:MAG: hypothetical protein LBV79_10685 [Candidatus Adiutrix sp.]|jgi:hypothetical protein|nr:hypothetical protein [Candidatus Adiutrix sp.]
MMKIFMALMLAFSVPAAAMAAEETPVTTLTVAKADNSATTFQYGSPSAEEAEEPAEAETAPAEPRQLQRSKSRPKVVTYGQQESAPSAAAPTEQPEAAGEARPARRGQGNTSQTTTFEYRRPAPPEAAPKAEKPKAAEKPKPVRRTPSQPQSTTFEYRRPAPAETAAPAPKAAEPKVAEEPPVKEEPAEPVVTTIQYQRPEPAEAAEAAKADPAPAEQPEPAAAPAPEAPAEAKDTPQEAAAAEAAEAETSPAESPSEETESSAAEGESPDEGEAAAEAAKAPAEEPRYTTLNQRSEELDMAKPEAAAAEGRAPTARIPRTKQAPASARSPLPTPAFDGSTSFNVAGIYVNCPDNDEAACGQAAEDFKLMFPKDQTAPYVMLRKDGRGYLAPDSKRTISFSWQFLGDNAILFLMEDARRRKVEYRTEGRYLRNMVTGDLFYMSLTDDEWNVEPEPFSQLQARKEKERKEQLKKEGKK